MVLGTRDFPMNKTDKIHAFMGLILEQRKTEKKQTRKFQSIITSPKEINKVI